MAWGSVLRRQLLAGQYGYCPNGNNLDKTRWTVDSAVVVRNYVMDDTVGIGGVRTKMAVKQLDCVIAPPDNSGITNHVELKISQNQIDVYATDAGVTPSPPISSTSPLSPMRTCR